MKHYPKSHLRTALILAFCLGIAIAALPERKSSTTSIPVSLSIHKSVAEQDADNTLANTQSTPTSIEHAIDRASLVNEKVLVRKGDSMSAIFKRQGYSAKDLYDIMSLEGPVKALKKIMPGQSLHFTQTSAGELTEFRYASTPLKQLIVTRQGEQFTAAWHYKEPEILISYKNAQITKKTPSLYHAGKAAGLSDNLIMELAFIFQWDVSFALDLRQGDSFTLLYEDIHVDGEKVKERDIIGAQFKNLGETHTAILFENKLGQKNYYTPSGGSMRKAFIRDPVHFSHVSSSFNLKRLHPIHKKVMPHRGIDYAANKGTPVLASGDGKVTIARQNNASGRYVVLRHGEQYQTKYLHLSAFAKGVRPGKSVKQGQVIGYVGATGWATAAHLHYEFLVNGVHRNPRTVKLPKANPISKAELAQFKKNTMPILARLESVTGDTRYAMSDD